MSHDSCIMFCVFEERKKKKNCVYLKNGRISPLKFLTGNDVIYPP